MTSPTLTPASAGTTDLREAAPYDWSPRCEWRRGAEPGRGCRAPDGCHCEEIQILLAHRASLESRLATLAAGNEALWAVVKPFADCWRPHKAGLEFTTIQVRSTDLAAAHRLDTDLTYGGAHADPA